MVAFTVRGAARLRRSRRPSSRSRWPTSCCARRAGEKLDDPDRRDAPTARRRRPAARVVARAGAPRARAPAAERQGDRAGRGRRARRCRCRPSSATSARVDLGEGRPGWVQRARPARRQRQGRQADRRARAHAAAARGRLRQRRWSRASPTLHAQGLGRGRHASCATSTSSSARARCSTSRTATRRDAEQGQLRYHDPAAARHQLRDRRRARGQRGHVAQDVHRAPRRRPTARCSRRRRRPSSTSTRRSNGEGEPSTERSDDRARATETATCESSVWISKAC